MSLVHRFTWISELGTDVRMCDDRAEGTRYYRAEETQLDGLYKVVNWYTIVGRISLCFYHILGFNF